MEDEKVNKALKLLEISNKGGKIPLTKETFEVILEKHPNTSEASNYILLEEKAQNVHPVIYGSIDSEMVRGAIKKTRGSASPLGLDGDGWCQILTSGNFGSSGEDLRKAIADMTKQLRQDNTVKRIEAFLSCRPTFRQTTWSLTYWNR